MKGYQAVIAFATIYLVIYTLTPHFGFYQLTLLMLAFSPLIVIWLVVSILKAEESSVREFAEGNEQGFWYDDTDWR